MPLPGLILAFALLFFRYSSFIATVPILGAQAVPVQIKLGLAAFLAAITLSAAPDIALRLANEAQSNGAQWEGLDYHFLGLLISEIAVGLLLALVVTGFFAAFQLAGYLMGFQMGFTLANVVDPLSQDQVSVIGQILFVMAVLIFLGVDGHHLLLRGLVESARLAPPGALALNAPSTNALIAFMQGIFVAALQVSMPVMGTLFLLDVGLGIIARTVPQMNVFMVGMPLKAGVGLLIFMLSMGGTAVLMEQFLADSIADWVRLMPLLVK